MFGRDPAKWTGRKITIRSEDVWSFGEKGPAIRVCGSPELTGPTKVDIDQGRLQIHTTLRPTRKRNGSPPTSRSTT
jgi:hypothetical protein